MTTLVLQSVGATIGSLFGPVGSAIGSAIGAAAGYALDSAIINSTKTIEGARLSGARPMSAEEGTPVARVYGYTKVAGTVIWATQLEERKTTKRQGAKGGPKVTTYSYFGNFALGLCEGEIAAVKRIWADGKELDLRDVNYRVYRGGEDQSPDALIEAKQGAGNAPTYKGLAYIVFERLPLERFGNRLPQIQAEIIRPVGKLEKEIRAISIIPGATEHGLDPSPVTARPASDTTVELNRHQLYGDTDWQASMDELQAVCPNLEHVSLVLGWFCDDLRADEARIRPGVVSRSADSESRSWRVSGLSRKSAQTHVVSKVDGRSSYGGTPNDHRVLSAIVDLKKRGLKVTLNPFVLMDIAPDNVLPNPDGVGFQPSYPWRGKITCDPAIDKTRAAVMQIEAFAGHSDASSLSDFGYRRMVLHYANLAVEAGGVDTIIIGSELRGLTSVRGPENSFPFVDILRRLAADVRAIVGPDCNIIYGADWSEYFGYHPDDGSQDVFFNLDPLWADANISAVAIDNYMPLSDWREADQEPGHENPDGATWRSDRAAFERAISAGEGYDWYYASSSDRAERLRSSITDDAYNKPWIFRYKDLKSWWENEHFERIGGVEQASPTAWQPQSKQIWFTELGCPAVNAGAGEPNAFVDAKSIESRLPANSNGARDDTEQRAFLQAHHSYWRDIGTRNPVSTISQLPMVSPERIYNWAWDARPFPVFPLNHELWGDGENWFRGHWLNGRLGTANAEDLIAAICADHEIEEPQIENVAGAVSGMVVPSPTSVRATIEPLLQLCNAVASDEGNQSQLVVRGMQAYAPISISFSDVVDVENEPLTSVTHAQVDDLPGEVMLTFRDPIDNYRSATSYSRRLEEATGGQLVFDAPVIIEDGAASRFADQMLNQIWIAQNRITFALPQQYHGLNTADVIAFDNRSDVHWMIEKITISAFVKIEARRIAKPGDIVRETRLPRVQLVPAQNGQFGGPPEIHFLDLPMGNASDNLAQSRIAVHSTPARLQAVFTSPAGEGFQYRTSVPENATIGRLNAPLKRSISGRIDYATTIDVTLRRDEFESVSRAHLLSGRNLLAIQSRSGAWEIVQFQTAYEIAPDRWHLTQLLRGQGGSEDAMLSGALAGAPLVVLDDAVLPIGLTTDEIGLELNARVGPAGKEFSDRFFTTQKTTLGQRALLPLSPVHLKAQRAADGAIMVTWIRRSRVNADSWLGVEIPLAEDSELYRAEIRDPAGQLLLNEIVPHPYFELNAELVKAHYAQEPASITARISQISHQIGDGTPAIATLKVQ